MSAASKLRDKKQMEVGLAKAEERVKAMRIVSTVAPDLVSERVNGMLVGDLIVAQHEAGHAVAAYVYGHTIEEVTVVPDPKEGSAGHCSSYAVGFPLHTLYSEMADLGRRKELRESMVVSLGGREAEAVA
jgi:hypothetical protein